MRSECAPVGWRLWSAIGLIVAAVLGIGAVATEAILSWLQPITTAYVYDPARDYRLRPGLDISFRGPEFDTRIVTGPLGLRGGVPTPSDPRQRILFLGDSFAFGHGVEAEEALPAQLERALGGRHAVINTGTPGYDTRREYETLRALGERFRARTVMIGFVLNDVLSNGGQFKLSLAATGVMRHLPLPALGMLLEYLMSDPASLLKRAGLQVPATVDHFECLRPGGCEEAWLATAHLLRQIRDEARAQGVERVILVHLPVRQEIEKDTALPDYQPDRAAERLRTIAGDLAMEYTSIGHEAGLGPDDYYPQDGHWRPRGHVLAADWLARTLGVP